MILIVECNGKRGIFVPLDDPLAEDTYGFYVRAHPQGAEIDRELRREFPKQSERSAQVQRPVPDPPDPRQEW